MEISRQLSNMGKGMGNGYRAVVNLIGDVLQYGRCSVTGDTFLFGYESVPITSTWGILVSKRVKGNLTFEKSLEKVIENRRNENNQSRPFGLTIQPGETISIDLKLK